jgi:hypothetical protein
MRKAPAYRIIPRNAAHFASETNQERTENLPRIGFLSLTAVPHIDSCLDPLVHGSNTM